MIEAIAVDPIFETDFVKEMARQMRALDTYGTYQGWTVEKILDPYVLTKERKANIPMIGDPDDETISRVKAYYNGHRRAHRKGMQAAGRAAGAPDA